MPVHPLWLPDYNTLSFLFPLRIKLLCEYAKSCSAVANAIRLRDQFNKRLNSKLDATEDVHTIWPKGSEEKSIRCDGHHDAAFRVLANASSRRISRQGQSLMLALRERWEPGSHSNVRVATTHG